MFLAAAYEAKADYLVSLDQQDLLPLKHYHGTQIVTPALFIRVLEHI
jgi:predicted nucleic acid-binding protein